MISFAIYDFGCAAPTDFWSHVFSAIPGAAICIVLLGGLAAIGCLLRRGEHFRSIDILSGWGVVAASMTLTGIFIPHAFLYTAYVIFGLMSVAALYAIRERYFFSP